MVGSTRRGVLVAVAAGCTVPAAGCLGGGDDGGIDRPDVVTLRERIVAFYDAFAANDVEAIEEHGAQTAESLAENRHDRATNWEYEVSVTDDEYNDETDVAIVYATITRRMPDDVVVFDVRVFLRYIDGGWRVAHIDRVVEEGPDDAFW